jgi:hypothetical protein
MDTEASAVPEAAAHTVRAHLPLKTWLFEGVRTGFLLRPRTGGAQPAALQLAIIVVALSLLEIALGRLEIVGPAGFNLRAVLAPWWHLPVVLLLAWWALPTREGESEAPAGLAAWLALLLLTTLPANLVAQLIGIGQAHEYMAWLEDIPGSGWILYLGLWAWAIAAIVRLSFNFGAPRIRLGALAVGVTGLFALTTWQFPDRPWYQDYSQMQREQPPQLQLSQATFEAQQAVWQRAVKDLAPQREGVADVYGIVFAPYASEDVFLREGTLVANVLAERFDAHGRLLHLANHATTAQSHPWATPLNLERAVDAIADRMDRENDVLVVYLTSHGARDFKLSAANPPLEVEPLNPGDLRRALDKAGIRNRVIAVSACYSGGWIGPLGSESTLVMTAADPDHTSYGCGRLSELTYFGRALFDEQLRKTHSFEDAFKAAVPVIRQREIDARKKDGFSNPQISVGEKIRPVLRELQARLAALSHDK